MTAPGRPPASRTRSSRSLRASYRPRSVATRERLATRTTSRRGDRRRRRRIERRRAARALATLGGGRRCDRPSARARAAGGTPTRRLSERSRPRTPLEMDDTHLGRLDPSGRQRLPGWRSPRRSSCPRPATALLRAAIAGYEGRGAASPWALGPAAHYRRGFHPTGDVRRLRRRDRGPRIVFGLDAAGPRRRTRRRGQPRRPARWSSSPTAPGRSELHPGWAACAGLHAGPRSRGAGIPARPGDDRRRTLRFSSMPTPTPPIPRRCSPPASQRSCGPRFKPHACCRYMQGPIERDASRFRARRRLAPGELGAHRGRYARPPAVPIVVASRPRRKRRPGSVVDAQFSLPFGIAAALRPRFGWAGRLRRVGLGGTRACGRSWIGSSRSVTRRSMPAFRGAWPCWVRLVGRDGKRRRGSASTIPAAIRRASRRRPRSTPSSGRSAGVCSRRRRSIA